LPSIREILRDNDNALLVPAGDVAALSQAIERILGDRDLAERLAQAALEDVPKYSWQRRAEQLESLFTESTAAGR
jgi:glycosyltransferase involved in cell wall biosynthesis